MKKKKFCYTGLLVITICILSNLFLNCQSTEEKKDAKAQCFYKHSFGIFFGWTSGGGDLSGFTYSPLHHYTNTHIATNPGFNLGGFFQYNKSDRIGLRLDFSFQNITYETTDRSYWSSQEKTIKKLSSISYLSFNIISYSKRFLKSQIYFLLGFGVNSSEVFKYFNSHYNFKIGVGGRSFWFKGKPNLALTYEISYRFLPASFDSNGSSVIRAGEYLFAHLGLEFLSH